MHHFIVEFEKALSPEFCNHLIEKFKQTPNKQAGRTGAGVDLAKKDSTDLYLSQHESWAQERNEIANIMLQATIAYAKAYPFILTGAISPSFQDPKTGEVRTVTHEDVANMPDEQIQQIVTTVYTMDDINMQHYTKGKGGYHHWHSEHYPHPNDPSQKSLHRTLLWLIYLNDVEKGGETEFFYQQAKLKPKQGSIVMAPCGFTHTHRGCVPESNDKYVLASWVIYNNAAKMYGQPQK